jgi:hypothetical protein
MRTRIFATMLLGALVAGCQAIASREAPMPAQSAQLICANYAVRTGTPLFDQCVAYQEPRNPGQSVPPYRLDQYNNRVDAHGYAVDSTGRRMPVQSPY